MPQALLPDINFIIQSLLQQLNISLNIKDRLSAANAIYSLNQLLPPEHQLKFSTKLYKQEITERKTVKCKSCKKENQLDKRKRLTSRTSYYDNLLGKDTSISYIRCTECNAFTALDSQAEYITHKINVNDYKAVFAPEEPKPKGLIIDSGNAIQFWQWAYLVRSLLLSKLRQFRESYQLSKGDGML